MKRSVLTFAAVVLAANTATELSAQRRVVPFFGAGAASGTGDLGDGTDTGWLVFAGLDWTIASLPGLSVGLTASFTALPYAGYDDALNIPAVFAELGYLFGATSASRIKPYIRGGLGFLQSKFDPGDLAVGAETNNEVGVGGGAGLNFTLGATALFAGAHYIYGLDEEATFFAIYGGLAFPGRAGSGGLRRR